MHRTIRKIALLIALVLTVPGCDGLLLPASADSAGDDELTILHVDPSAPPLDATQVTFWMVRGESREVQIRYVGVGGYNGKCIRLVVPAEAPLRDASGKSIERGDSIQVTLRIVDPDRFLFEILPEGVLLNPAQPAQLEIRYWWMSADANGDGVVDSEDADFASRFGLWGQAETGGRWMSQPQARRVSGQEIQAPITLFGRYALASD